MVSTSGNYGPRVAIAGDGVVGLSIALHLAARGVSVSLLCPGLSGSASRASAGMLAPSVERAQGPAQNFSDAARDAWGPLREIARAFGSPSFDIQRDGILQITRTDADAAKLRATLTPGDVWLVPADARARVPLLGDVAGAALYAGDGFVDVPAAMAALEHAVRAAPRISMIETAVSAITRDGTRVRCALGTGETLEADHVVLAAGAWTAAIRGVPRAIPVLPLRGTVVALDCAPPPFPVYDAEGHAYVLPRHSTTLVGATSDEAGFDVSSRAEDTERLVAAAAAMMPALAAAAPIASWTGVRPMTPDRMAMLGPDPEWPQLIYALGHGRNGFLQAAVTGEVVAAIVLGEAHMPDISCFDPARFG